MLTAMKRSLPQAGPAMVDRGAAADGSVGISGKCQVLHTKQHQGSLKAKAQSPGFGAGVMEGDCQGTKPSEHSALQFFIRQKESFQ